MFTSKSVGKTWRLKTPAKMCCTFLGKSAGEAGRVFHALETHILRVVSGNPYERGVVIFTAGAAAV